MEVLGRIRRGAVGFVVGWALVQLVASSAFAADSSNSTQLQTDVVQALIAGRDVGPLLARLKAAKLDTQQVTPPASTAAAQFEHQLDAFRSALKHAIAQGGLNTRTQAPLLGAYTNLQAANLLLKQRFAIVKQRLAASNAGATFEQRRADAQSAYEDTAQGLFDLLNDSLGALQRASDPKALLADESFRSDALSALKDARDYLAKHAAPVSHPILRASTLPYRRTALAQRTPITSPTITPAYRQPDDSAAQPAGADLAATVDAPLSPAILAKAKALGYDYIRIYQFVRNQVRTQWYAGAMKGAEGTLAQMSGNDVDQASLLIALFRASGLPCRYVHGVIELPIESVMNSLGLTDPTQATVALTRAGVAYTPVVQGGRVAAVQLEYTWVEAYAPYSNYRGAVVDTSGKSWIPLAPAIKDYTVTAPSDILRTMNLSVDDTINAYLQKPQTTDLRGMVDQAVQDYLTANHPDQTIADQLGSTTIVADQGGLLPNTLPVPVVAVTGEEATLSDAYRQRVELVVHQGTAEDSPVVLDYTVPVSSLAGQRVTLSYIPATVDDQETMDSFGGMDQVPAYLIKLRAQIKVNGRQVAVASDSMDMGATHRFDIHVLGPFGEQSVTESVTAGGYEAVDVSAQDSAPRTVTNDPGDTEYDAARLLDRVAKEYDQRWRAAEDEFDGLLDVSVVRPLPAITVVGNQYSVDTVLGRPYQLSWQGVTIDAALRVAEPLTRGTDAQAPVDWMRLSALQGSSLEHEIFEDLFDVDSVSADKGLQLAQQQGITIASVDSANEATVVPTLQLPSAVITDIQNWVRQGLTVQVPISPVSYDDWTGSVWRVEDPGTGGAGYFISGGLAGGSTALLRQNWGVQGIVDTLVAPYAPPPDLDPNSAGDVAIVSASDSQVGTVGKTLPTPLAVRVRDFGGSPVKGALVKFDVTQGGGTLAAKSGDAGASSVTVQTNQFGIAQAYLTLGQKTAASPLYVMANPGDQFATEVGVNEVDVAVAGQGTILTPSHPFQAIAMPGPATQLVRTDPTVASGPAGMWVDAPVVEAQDQYGNSISNVDVTFAMGGMSNSCSPPPASPLNGAVFDPHTCSVIPTLGECGSNSLSVTTSAIGANAGVILGNSAGGTYSMNVSAPNTSGLTYTYTTTGGCNAGPQLTYESEVSINENGNTISAAKIGEQSKQPVLVTLKYSVPSYQVAVDNNGKFYIQWLPGQKWVDTTGNVQINVTNGGSASPAVNKGSYYESYVTTGMTPGDNVASLNATNVNMEFPSVDPDTGTVYTQAGSGSIGGYLTDVYGLDPKIVKFTAKLAGDNKIVLTHDNTTQEEVSLLYHTDPTDYTSLTSEVDFLKNGIWQDYAVGSTRSGDGTVTISRGTAFDPNQTYEAQVVLNRGTNSEVKSDPVKMPIKDQLVQAFYFDDPNPLDVIDHDVYLYQSVDVINKTACEIGHKLYFRLARDAVVTLKFTEVSSGAETTLIDNQTYTAGLHYIQISPYDLLPDRYDFVFHAVAAADSTDVQDIKGKALSQFDIKHGLPVGHVTIKGVDLFDGHVNLHATDLKVPGRGPNLEFRRAYVSNSPYRVGPLGVGWTFNYASYISIDQCGVVHLSGGDGSGQSFFLQSDGSYKTAKGYHGTLKKSTSDDGFDFYSRDGTHYHYRYFYYRKNGVSHREWWLQYIEDTNGNVTKLAYDPGSVVPKLMTVQDSAGRTLKFTYDLRTFPTQPFSTTVNVITKVVGPDGESVSFKYDSLGDLISAAREKDANGNDTRVETYTYAPTTDFLNWGKLTSYTDPKGAVTNYAFNEKPILITDAGGTTLSVQSGMYTSVTDPQGGVTKFDYDYAGLASRPATGTVTKVDDPNGHLTTYSLNSYGAPLSITNAAGTTTMTWPSDDVQMTSKTDANGVTTDYTYDANGNMLTEKVNGGLLGTSYTRSFTYATIPGHPEIKNRVETRTDRNGNVTKFKYDDHGNLIQVTDALGGVTQYQYASNGDRIRTIDPNGNSTRFSYDPTYGYLVSKTDAQGNTTTNAWDVRGRLTSTTDKRGYTTEFAYDTLNRLIKQTDPYGNSKSYTYDAAGNKLTETDEAGRVTTWTYDGNNRVTTITDPLGHVKTMHYDAAGNKTRESDWQGNDTTFDYDAVNRVVTKTAPMGRVTTYTYDPVGNLLTETDANGNTTSYTYDILNRKLTVTDALNGTTTYTYDGNGNKTSVQDALGRTTTYTYDALNHLTQKTDALGGTTTYKYDPNGNRISTTDANGNTSTVKYDTLNRPVKKTDPLGNATTLYYDPMGNLTRTVDARLHATQYTYDKLDRRASMTDALSNVTTYAYDKVGNKTSETLPNGNVVNYTYDKLNRLTTKTDKLGAVASYQYDANGNKTQSIDANGNITTYTYDALNELTNKTLPEGRTVAYGYDLVGNKTSQTDPNGNTRKFAYDKLNRLTSTTDALGNSSSVTYDAVGNKLTATDKRGNTTHYTYDALNRRTQVTDPLGQTLQYTYDPVGNKLTETDKRGTVTAYTYDPDNRVLTITKDNLKIATYQYDAVGNKTFQTDAKGNITAYVYDARNQLITESRLLAAITNYKYDVMGNRAQRRDPEGRITAWTYDLRNRKLTQTNGAGDTTSYTYDGNGNRTSKRRPNGNTWTYAYDGANRLTSVTDPLSGVTKFTYDKNNNRLSQTDANGNTTSFKYDALNRKIETDYPDGATETFTYDANGNRTGLTDPKGQVFSYTFDALNRQTLTSYPAPAAPTGDDVQSIAYGYDPNNNPIKITETYSGASGTRVTTKQYDHFDRLVAVTDVFGKTINYAYDANGNRTSLTDPDGKVTLYAYDALNRLIDVTTGGGTTSYAYDRSSLKTKVVYPNGTTATYDYDGAKRITHIDNAQGTATVSSYDYTYDKNGNRLTQIETNGGAAQTTTYQYDADDRLTDVLYPDADTGYTYDADYNRLTETTVENGTGATLVDKTYVYNTRNELTSVTDAANSANDATYQYDANGNQTVKSENGTVTTFLYDVRDQLITVRQGTTTLGQYQYDYAGMRVAKTGADGLVRYTYDGKSVLVQTDGTGKTLAKYNYGPQHLLSLDQVTQGRQYYLFDALGSTVDLITMAGTVQARYQYDAWGNLRAHSGSSWNEFTYTGHEKDPATGLYYFKARYYDPTTARFLSADSYLGKGFTPPSLHRYLYAYANPTVYADLSGYYSWHEFWSDTKHVAHEAWTGTRNTVERFVGGISGASLAIVFIAKDTAQLAYDAQQTNLYYETGGLLGDKASVKRMQQMGRGLAMAIRHPIETARAVGHHFASAYKGAMAEDSRGNHFTAGVVFGKTTFDIYAIVRTLPEIAAQSSRLATVARLSRATGRLTEGASEADAAASMHLESQHGPGTTSSEPIHVAKAPTTEEPPAAQQGEGNVPKETPQTLVEHVENPNPKTGEGYGVNNPPVRIGGDWSRQDYFNALNGRTPKGLGKPDLHHAEQMPGSGIHEVIPSEHRGNAALHGQPNQGVTPEMRKADKELHWWYRAREQGADTLFPQWIYDE